MGTRPALYSALLLMLAVTSGTAQMPPVLNVRKIEEPVACTSYTGVVDKIDDDEVSVVVQVRNGITKTHTLVPIDRLREGGYIHEHYNGENAYLWKDIKKGDTVRLAALRDDGDGKMYCLQVSIRRRPGCKLPPSQNPKEDSNYNANRLLNDIENGEDVSDEELLKEWPPHFNTDKKVHRPGGLYAGKYKEMLDANRKRIAEEKEKKEKELKAKSIDKK